MNNTEINRLSADEIRAIDERKLKSWLQTADPIAKTLVWLFLPGFLRRLRALFKGEIAWTL